MPYVKAVRLIHHKEYLAGGIVIEVKIWKVPPSQDFPEGFKYSLFAVRGGKTLVGYDNHRPKGHHRHLGDEEQPYHFRDIDRLEKDFRADIQEALKATSRRT
jgi:Family of unknown function (DUF6516)